MKTALFTYTILFLIIILAGCKSDKDIPEYPLQAEFLAYMYFAEGTYWVYEDTATGALDSAAVKANSKLYVDEYNRDVLQSKRETFQYTMEFPATGRNELVTGESTCESGETGKRCGFAIHSRADLTSVWSYLYFYPPEAGTRAETPAKVFVTLEQILPEIEIAGEKFQNVVEIHDPKNPVEADMETYYLIAPNIGIIQKRLRPAGGAWQVWNLTRWNIVQ